ncbi:hypothetical protein SAMN05444161_8551 [Rhizobiales bacterium GAS191]|nr:hypothetical protein SAMN05444161_8551 [Rhizobiales bacterium GAS191]
MELRSHIPAVGERRQQLNRAHARRIARSVARNSGLGPEALASLEIRALALACMVDDVLRETFVIGNPALPTTRDFLDRLAV